MLLRDAGKEAGDVDEGDDRNIEGVAEADEARRLFRAGDAEHAVEHPRLVGDDADREALDPAEAEDDDGGVGGLDLEEIALVADVPDQLVTIAGRVGTVRDQGAPGCMSPVYRSGSREGR